jgi:hypothetical protein
MAEATRSDPKRCAGTKKDGTPCTAPVMGEGAYCFAHDPARAGERERAREKGGANSATRARIERLVPSTLRPTIGKLIDALDEVHDGKLDPKVANAMAALAGAIVRAYNIGVVEQRLEALEQAQQGQHGGRWA